MMRFWMKYYALNSENEFEEVLDTQVYVVSANARRSSDPDNNNCTITLNNPITDWFSDGSPRRQFVDVYGDAYFKASEQNSSTETYEERMELYAKDCSDFETGEEIATGDNLIFSGQIKEAKYTHDSKSCSVKLTLSDRTFNIMNRIWSNAYDDMNTPELLQEVTRQVTEDLSSSIGYDANGTEVAGGKYLVDARLFSEGIKTGSETITGYDSRVVTCSGATFITDGVNVGDMIKNETTFEVAIVKSVNSETSITVSKSIFTVGDSIKISDGFIQDWRPVDGSAFPTITYSQTSVAAIDWIEEIVQTEYTNSELELSEVGTQIVFRAMVYYLDGYNRLHAFVPDNNSSVEIKMGQTSPVGDDLNTYRTHSTEMTKGIYDVINFIIFTCGEDMNDYTYTWYAQDPSAGGPNVKDCAREYPKISQKMKVEDYIKGNITYDGSSTFSYPTTYPMIPAWSSAGTSVSDDTEYNKEFRIEGRKRGKAQALKVIDDNSSPRWSGKVEVGFFNFSPSDLITFTDRDIGITNLKIRITEVQHNISKSGFFTTLTLEEDSIEDE